MAEERRIVKLGELEARGLSLRFPDGTELVVTTDDVLRFLVRGKASREEAVLFLAYCATRSLNPLEDDLYLVKYDEDEPARIVIGKHGFLKLAHRAPGYTGHTSGIFVRTKEGRVETREGTFYEKDKEILVGGWAEVYRKDRAPYAKRVLLEEFNPGRKMWRTMPAVMIEKVALVNALREAFPDLGLGVVVPEEELEEPEDTEARQRKAFWATARRLGYDDDGVHEALGVTSVNDWRAQGKTYAEALEVLRAKRVELPAPVPAEAPTGAPTPRFKNHGEVADWAYKTYDLGTMKILADFRVSTWKDLGTPDQAAAKVEARYGKKGGPGEAVSEH